MRLNQIETEYNELIRVKAIKENSIVHVHFKWAKAVNDLALSEGLLKLSTNDKIKDSLDYPENTTFFDWAIVSSYYSIFHAAQALLGLKNIKIVSRLHHATMVAFARHYIVNNELAEELFLIYEDAESRANELLDIYEEEKAKRGDFQYHRLSKNNLEPAQKSIENAKKFLEAVQEVLSKNKAI